MVCRWRYILLFVFCFEVLVRRMCLGDGEWGEVDVSACQRQVFSSISMEVRKSTAELCAATLGKVS